MRLRRGFKGWWLALIALAADQITKAIIRGRHVVAFLIPGILHIHPMRNRGIAFSLFYRYPQLLTGITAAILLALTAFVVSRPDDPPLVRAGYWMILGGGMGNLLDRLLYGAVTDFVDLPFLHHFAIFNVADVFVCVGALLAVAGTLIGERRAKERGNGEI